MNNTYIFLIAVFLIPLSLMAQKEQKITNLKTPQSPAANIIGMVPGTVLQPKSYQALEVAMFSNFLNGDKLTSPDNYSLEFSPYWFKDHGVSLKNYLSNNSFGNQLKQNSSFSLASTQSYLLADSTKTNSLSFGYRTSFFLPNAKDKTESTKLLKGVYENFAFISELAVYAGEALKEDPGPVDAKVFMARFKPLIKAKLEESQVDEGVIDDFVEVLSVEIEKLKGSDFTHEKIYTTIDMVSVDYFKMNEDSNKLAEYINNRYGFYIDVAYANFLNFPTNEFEYSIAPRQSIWLTPSYRFSGHLKNFKLIGVFRYQWNNLDYFEKYFPSNIMFRNNFDYGIALNGTFNKFSAYLEMVGRRSNTEIRVGTDDKNNVLYRKDKESDVQYLGTLSYRLTDQIVLSYSLGKNFQILNSKGNDLISLLSLNFGFGAPVVSGNKSEK